MIERDDATAGSLRRMLAQRANEAPQTVGLSERVERAANARRKRRAWVAVAAVGLVSVAAPFAVAQVLGGSSTPAPTATSADGEWRWESFRGVEVRVPAGWDHGTIGAWCADSGDGTSGPSAPGRVGRPGILPSVMCPYEHPPVAQRRPWVKFDLAGTQGAVETDGGWVAETREVGGVFVTVFSPAKHLRETILGSAHPVTGNDRHGCAPAHDVAVGRDFRPTPSTGGLPKPEFVEHVSVCRYARSDTPHTQPPLLSASRISGSAARSTTDAVHAAPKGTGPNDAANCSAASMFGEEVLLLRVHSRDGVHEIVVRYHGCDGHLIDDGKTTRALTADVLRPLLTGPHMPPGLHGPVAELVWPQPN